MSLHPFPIGLKDIGRVTRRFHADLRGLVTLGFISDSSILADMRRLVKNAVEDAYLEVLKDNGIPPEEMDIEDAQNIDQLNLTQQDYVTAFVRAIREAKGDRAAQRDILNNRVDLWTASIAAIGDIALASIKRNEMVTWHLGATEEHCTTCAKLDGQTHRRKWFSDRDYYPRKPGAAMDCGGWRCLCTLE